jgi:hypothetical protein
MSAVDAMEKEGRVVVSELRVPRGPERRDGDRRAWLERRYTERRDPVRATAGRRGVFPFDRRVAERRMLERRTNWPEPQAQ